MPKGTYEWPVNMSVFASIAECWHPKTGVLAGIGGVQAANDLRFRAIRPGKRGFVGSYLRAIQAYHYAINLPCDWIIVTSMRETRLYYKGAHQ
jgi:hypothetical protein